MLETLLYPKAIAVIGASRNPDKVGYAVLANLVNNGFKGPIVPVNLDADEILGLKCYKSLGEYKDPIDLSIIMVAGQIRERRPAEARSKRAQNRSSSSPPGSRKSARRARRPNRSWSKFAVPAACGWLGRIAWACSTRTIT